MLRDKEPIRAKFGSKSCQSKWVRVCFNRHHGDYCLGRVYKQGKRRRQKVGHKAFINWIY